MKHETREPWFLAAAKQIEQSIFKPAGYELPRFRIGCGWPTTKRDKTGAECFNSKRSEDKTYEIFVSPKFSDSLKILEIIVHELCHTIAGIEAGHRKPFIEIMRAVGMVKPWTGSRANEELAAKLAVIQEKLGPYPHAKLGLKKRKSGQKGSRLIKVQCPKCEYIARVTRKWLTEAGAPICPVHKVAFRETEVKK